MKCQDCNEESEDLKLCHNDNGETVTLCYKCRSFPYHEYGIKCAHCDLIILVN